MYMMSIFCLTGCLLFADQNLMAPNLTAIAKGQVCCCSILEQTCALNIRICHSMHCCRFWVHP